MSKGINVHLYAVGGDFYIDLPCEGGRFDGQRKPWRVASRPAVEATGMKDCAMDDTGDYVWHIYECRYVEGVPIAFKFVDEVRVRHGEVVNA